MIHRSSLEHRPFGMWTFLNTVSTFRIIHGERQGTVHVRGKYAVRTYLPHLPSLQIKAREAWMNILLLLCIIHSKILKFPLSKFLSFLFSKLKAYEIYAHQMQLH